MRCRRVRAAAKRPTLSFSSSHNMAFINESSFETFSINFLIFISRQNRHRKWKTIRRWLRVSSACPDQPSGRCWVCFFVVATQTPLPRFWFCLLDKYQKWRLQKSCDRMSPIYFFFHQLTKDTLIGGWLRWCWMRISSILLLLIMFWSTG